MAPIPHSLAPLVSNVKKKHIKDIVVSSLFYTRAVYPIILPALNDVAAEQSAPKIKIDKAVRKLLNLCRTYSNTSIVCLAIDMVLHIDSDIYYLSLLHARSRTT